MQDSKPGLFVYGTLHPDRAPDEIKSVVQRMTPIGPGTVVGTLHNLGSFPGLVLTGKKARIRGTVFALPDDPEALRQLDAYEEYQPAAPHQSLFVRTKRTVTLDNGRKQQHWVYVYNQPLSADVRKRA